MGAGRSRADRRQAAEVEQIGKFEEHTKGIGMKLLQKMGYKKGEGLGKRGQGVAAPVEARLRPKKVGLGLGEPPSPQEPWWQKGFGENLAGAGRRREAPRTVEDVLKESEAREEPSAAGVVLDMRGPQVRVVQHTGELGADPLHAGAKDPTPFPEVQHGLKLALDLFEADVRAPEL